MKNKKQIKAEQEKLKEGEYKNHLKYIMNVETLEITVEEGGFIIFQSGNPPPPPPYGGG